MLTLPPGESPLHASLQEGLHVPQQPDEAVRTISACFISHNIGGVGNVRPINKGRQPNLGVAAYTGKMALLSAQYGARGAHFVGIQEAHSRASGINEVGAFMRLVPPVDSQAARDVELWINKQLPWDPTDPTTKLDRSHLQVTGVGPKFFCVSIRSHFLRIDVVVGHAPHAWDEADTEAVDKAKHFWSALDRVLTKRPPPWAPLLLLLDTNIEVPPIGNLHVGTHAPPRTLFHRPPGKIRPVCALHFRRLPHRRQAHFPVHA